MTNCHTIFMHHGVYCHSIITFYLPPLKRETVMSHFLTRSLKKLFHNSMDGYNRHLLYDHLQLPHIQIIGLNNTVKLEVV